MRRDRSDSRADRQKRICESIRRLQTLLLFMLILVFVGSAALLARSYSISAREQGEFALLTKQVKSARSQAPTPRAAPAEDVESAAQQPVPTPEVLEKYAALYAENPDFGGWIRIDGTVIDYPVMFTPEEPEYYLKRDFSGAFSYSGVPFVGAGCELWPRSDNIILYGHHMEKGTMFASITKYKDQSFREKYPTLYFSTRYDEAEYEIFAAVETDLFSCEELRCYSFIKAQGEEDFDNFIDGIRKASLYDTDVEVKYGDELVTLSTCAYHTAEGRFLIIAKRTV